MNRWLTRKKDVADDSSSVKKAKKGKKGQEEVKPDFNLDTVLPKADDFRTSLIMPGLSTRFSMLREQDDPASKLGKAMDDSVLQPKRQSRLHEFGFVPGGLSDIAEVSSLNGSIRPPFAKERQGSFASTQTQDDDGSGSVMNRARPGEGNVLFGGRQKIYVISNTSKGLGRTLYDDDVNMSAYQKLRQEEKERLRQQDAEYQDQQSEPSSPSALSRKRETSSSTNSGTMPTRISTAATSIASQGANSVQATSPAFPTFNNPTSPQELNRSMTKARRLYDQGLDQHIQEQQSSSTNRLNSIQRVRAPTGRSTPPLPFAARSATNLNERFNRGPAFRSESPVPSVVSRNNSSAGSSPVLPRPQSPAFTSPVTSDSEDAYALNAALQPHDRGKATALGAFNKPKEAFSEEQYAERMKHMQRGKVAPGSSQPKVERSPPRKPTLRERAEQEKRRRAEVENAEQSQPESPVEQAQAPSAFSRFQAAASQMRVNGPAAPMSQPTQLMPPTDQKKPSSTSNGATFLTSPDSSEDEQDVPRSLGTRAGEPTRRYENIPVATGPAPSIFEHPALRSRSTSEEQVNQLVPQTQVQTSSQGLLPQPEHSTRVGEADVDSPTLGPDKGGLSGLIRQHLRNVSNVSSNYDGDGSALSPPALTPAGLAIQTNGMALQPRQPGSENVTPAPSTYSHSNPWDLDDLDNPYRDETPNENAGSRNNVTSGSSRTPEPTEHSFQWDLTPKRTHERIASNETEADHEAFQRDLAQRQRVIQEGLRARAEGRSTSPAPASAGGGGGGLKTALNLLRAKSSRESFATVDRHPELPGRPLRKLTMGAGSNNASTTSLANLQSSEHSRGESPALRNKPSRVLQQSEQDAQRETRQRSGTDSSRTGRSAGRSSSANTRGGVRDRSGSGTSNSRSRSRPDYYRDDLQQAMMEGTRGAYPPNTGPSTLGYAANQTPPLPMDRPSLDAQTRMRSRSNSRTAASNYFESKHLQPIQTAPSSGGASPRLPLQQGKFSPGLPVSPRPSPGGFPGNNGYSAQPSPIPPFSADHTPPVSNPVTPSTAAFNPKAIQPIIRQGVLRKKSVAKSEISEPVFISTTSVIDTVNLPPGASLKNGVDQVAPPPVPPINPMRKRFGFGRQDSSESTTSNGFDAPRPPYAEPTRTNSSDALSSQIPQPRNRLRKTSSEGHSLHAQAQLPNSVSPAMPQGGFTDRNNSPPRPINSRPIAQQQMEGAMF